MKQALINTYSGKVIDLLNPKVSDIALEDIARGIAYKSHYIGQTPFYFSVAEHSILVSVLTGDMEGLMHDASEAYLSDIAKPLKVYLPEYKIIENRLMEVIFERFSLNFDKLESGKWADIELLGSEFEIFFGDKGLQNPFTDEKERLILRDKSIFTGYSPDDAYNEFIKRYHILKSIKNKNNE